MGRHIVERRLAWFYRTFSIRYFQGRAGGRIRYGVQNSSDDQAVLVIVPGRTEFIEKYAELAHDLKDSGYSLCLIDHYGQGRSGRPLADRHKGHIDDFSTYADDLCTLLERYLPSGSRRPVVLLTHSMGGTAAAMVTVRRPDLVDGLIMVSPMLQINTGPFLPPWLVESVSGAACLMGASTAFVFGGRKFDPDMAFEGNPLTGDARRFQENIDLVRNTPELGLGAPTFGWLYQAYRAMRVVRRRAGEISCGMIAFTGGLDTVIGLPAVERFVRQLPTGELLCLPEARHEILMEQDDSRNRALER